ncbi:hypothetical protein J4H86_18640 [Spiractinospora alimapuensis]|nr:hypothetical protein J4H86_18640 [Spiractinospora alimapuensis]
MSLLVEGFANAQVEVELLPPTTLRIQVPGHDPVEADYESTVAEARAFEAEDYPEIAAQVVRALLRRYRENGIRLGTHYPPHYDDHGRHALVTALAERDLPSFFEDPRTLSLPLSSGDRVISDVSSYIDTVEGVSAEQAEEAANRFADLLAQQLAQIVPQRSAPDSQIRVRLYPESAFSEEVLAGLLCRPFGPGLWQVAALDSPDTVQPMGRQQHEETGRPDDEVFAAGVANALREPVEVSRHEIGGVTIVHVGGQHPYVAAQLHNLGEHIGPAPHGALVAVPVPQVVMAHVLGDGHPIAALETLQNVAQRFVDDSERPITPHLYWWRPAGPADDVSAVPELHLARIEIEEEDDRVALYSSSDDFQPMMESVLESQRAASDES